MTLTGRFIEELTWPEVAEAFRADMPVVLPIGAAAKEHGHHLPMKTDWLLARALADGIAARLPVLIAPIVPFGYYPVFRTYPGSQHLSAGTFVRLLTELLEGYIDQGARRLAIVNTGVSTEAPIGLATRTVLE
ncbi:MAG TPA: creatininase family protein, partial [Sphingomicrobium sp.]|nr:creatininase family protein [Sphingomicrobium sp.]